MNRRAKIAAMPVVVGSVIALVVGFSGTAYADESSPTGGSEAANPVETIREIFKTDQTILSVEKSQAAQKAATGANQAHVQEVTPYSEIVPADEVPNVGESVLVHYADANVVREGLAADCVVSGTAGTPYYSDANGYRVAYALTKYSVSAGCSNHASIAWGYLSVAGERDSVTWKSITAGQSRQEYLSWTCNNHNTSPAQSRVTDRYDNQLTDQLVAQSATVNMPCGY